MKRRIPLWPVVVIASLPGCPARDREGRDAAGSAWDDAVQVPILEPFQGTWHFD